MYVVGNFNMFRIHLTWNVSNLFSIEVFITIISKPYNNLDLSIVLNICGFLVTVLSQL